MPSDWLAAEQQELLAVLGRKRSQLRERMRLHGTEGSSASLGAASKSWHDSDRALQMSITKLQQLAPDVTLESAVGGQSQQASATLEQLIQSMPLPDARTRPSQTGLPLPTPRAIVSARAHLPMAPLAPISVNTCASHKGAGYGGGAGGLSPRASRLTPRGGFHIFDIMA